MTDAQDRFRRIRAALNAGRGVLTTLGYYTTRIFVVVRVWEGGRRSADGGWADQAIYQGKVLSTVSGTGLITGIESGLEILPRPKVRFIRTSEMFMSGGLYHDGDLKVTYIQPFWTDAQTGTQKGYTVDDIAPTPTEDGSEVFYRLQGSVNGEYFRVGSITEKFGHYELTLRSRLTTPTKNNTGIVKT